MKGGKKVTYEPEPMKKCICLERNLNSWPSSWRASVLATDHVWEIKGTCVSHCTPFRRWSSSEITHLALMEAAWVQFMAGHNGFFSKEKWNEGITGRMKREVK